MAISRTRLTAPLTRGNVPEEHAAEFTDALIDEVERELEPLAAKSEIEEAIGRALEPLVAAMEEQRQDMRELRQDMRELRQEMGELRQQVQDQRVQIADSEARLSQQVQDQRVQIADSEARLSQQVQDQRQDTANLRTDAAERDNHLHQRMALLAFAAVGISLTAIGIATAVIIAVLV